MSFPPSSLSSQCPSCSRLISHDFNYCPFCGHMVRLVCAACQSALQDGWTWCPTCGQRTTQDANSMPTRVISGGLDAGTTRPVNQEAEDFNQRGVELYEAERYDDAIQQFQRAISLDPANSLYHCNLAVAYGEKGDAARALEEYQRAIQLNPSDLTAHLNLGYSYSMQGHSDLARQEWDTLVAIAPSSPEAEEARDNLRNLDS